MSPSSGLVLIMRNTLAMLDMDYKGIGVDRNQLFLALDGVGFDVKC